MDGAKTGARTRRLPGCGPAPHRTPRPRRDTRSEGCHPTRAAGRRGHPPRGTPPPLGRSCGAAAARWSPAGHAPAAGCRPRPCVGAGPRAAASPAPAALAPAPPSAGGREGPGRVWDRLGMPLLSRHHRDFGTRHLPHACDVRRVWDDACAPRRGHALDLVGRPLECLGAWFMRPLQSPDVAAEHPDPPRLVMTSQEGPGQVVARRLIRLALLPRSCRWGRVATLCGEVGRAAVGPDHTSCPAARPAGVETLRVSHEMLDGPSQGSGAGVGDGWATQREP